MLEFLILAVMFWLFTPAYKGIVDSIRVGRADAHDYALAFVIALIITIVMFALFSIIVYGVFLLPWSWTYINLPIVVTLFSTVKLIVFILGAQRYTRARKDMLQKYTRIYSTRLRISNEEFDVKVAQRRLQSVAMMLFVVPMIGYYTLKGLMVALQLLLKWLTDLFTQVSELPKQVYKDIHTVMSADQKD